jgi:hypothetical protein
MLEELPETLDETYERMLRNIHKANRAARLCPSPVAMPRGSRSSSSGYRACGRLAIDFGTATSGGISMLNPNWGWEDQQQAVLSTCSSLVSVVDQEGTQVVQFSHFSVKDLHRQGLPVQIWTSRIFTFISILEPSHAIFAKIRETVGS